MWKNVNIEMPERNVYVLIHTPNCRYKCSIAFWTGLDWISSDCVFVSNVINWQPLPDTSNL